MNKKEKIILIVAVVIVLNVIGAVIVGARKRKKKQLEIREIMDRINQDIGAAAQDTVTTLLYKVAPAKYDATRDVETLYRADGVLWDSDQVVWDLIAKRSKAQLKTIDQTMLRLKGISLDTFLVRLFKDWQDAEAGCLAVTGPMSGSFCSFPKYEKAIAMIKSAA